MEIEEPTRLLISQAFIIGIVVSATIATVITTIKAIKSLNRMKERDAIILRDIQEESRRTRGSIKSYRKLSKKLNSKEDW